MASPNKLVTLNLSPKIVRSVASAVVSYVITRLGLSVDPDVSAVIAGLIASVIGYFAPPGEVVPLRTRSEIPPDVGDAGRP